MISVEHIKSTEITGGPGGTLKAWGKQDVNEAAPSPYQVVALIPVMRVTIYKNTVDSL